MSMWVGGGIMKSGRHSPDARHLRPCKQDVHVQISRQQCG